MIAVHLAKKEDFDFFYEIKCSEFNIYWTGYSTSPEYYALKEFFLGKIENQHIKSNRKIYVTEDILSGEKYAYMYLDPIDCDNAEASIAVSDKYIKRGIGKKSINILIELARAQGYNMLIGYIREDNVGSQRLCESVGFKKTEKHRLLYLEQNSKGIKMFQYVCKIK